MAADADEKLRRQGALAQAANSSSGLSGEEQARRLAAIASVDADDFLPQEFRSSKSEVCLVSFLSSFVIVDGVPLFDKIRTCKDDFKVINIDLRSVHFNSIVCLKG